YNSDRYRMITSTQERYSVHTTFMQFLSAIHEARVTNTLGALSDRLVSGRRAAQAPRVAVFSGGCLGSEARAPVPPRSRSPITTCCPFPLWPNNSIDPSSKHPS